MSKFMDQFRLDGRVALVTGASQNIGKSLAIGLAEAGADLIVTARGRERLEDTAREIAKLTGRKVVPIAGHMGSKEDVERIVVEGHAAFDRMDVLVNNAYATGYQEGIRTFPQDPLGTSDEQWMEVFSANILGNYRLIRGFADRLKKHDKGSVINVLSGSGFQPNLGMMCYGSTKANLWMMTKYLAKEVPDIRFNALIPGLVNDTGTTRSVREESVLPLIPMNRVGHPDEMVGACIYLASDASSYTTGAHIFCNGGRPW